MGTAIGDATLERIPSLSSSRLGALRRRVNDANWRRPERSRRLAAQRLWLLP